MKQTILIVEDEEDINNILAKYLQAAKFETKSFMQGTGVVEWIQQQEPSLVLLDIDLPGKDGLTICKKIRNFSNVPIIMTTAKVEEIDRLIGLEVGADDYVCKPYSAREVVARVQANLRRFDNKLINSKTLILDTDSFCIRYQDITTELTAIEFALFHLLYSNPNRIYSRAQIIALVYHDYRDISDRAVDSHIKNLRKKLNMFQLKNEMIRSIYGAGYKFEMPR